MSSFFQKILSDPLSNGKGIGNVAGRFKKASTNEDGKHVLKSSVTDATNTNVSLTGEHNGKERKLENGTVTTKNVGEELSENYSRLIQIQHSTNIKIPCIPNLGPHNNSIKDLPSIPSPSRYGAIEALDIGDEERELERWAERTETITRFEHET